MSADDTLPARPKQPRYLYGPDRRPRPRTKEEWMERCVPRGPSDACWEWTGRRSGRGYGRVRLQDRKNYLAHRLAYEVAFGPIPDGLSVCHRCDNPPCCNPAHLFLGTHQDNANDMLRKGRSARGNRNGTKTKPHSTARGERSGACKFSEATIREVRRLAETRMLHRVIGERLGISTRHVSQIVRRDVWKHLP